MDQLGITVFDVAVIAVAVFGAAMGLSAGFAHAVLFIFSWLASGWISWKFAHVIQPEIQNVVGSPELSYFVSLLVLFIAALIALILLTNALSHSIRFSPLRRPDRILDAGFGVLVAWVVMGTGLVFYNYLGPRQMPATVENGRTYPMISDMAKFVEPHLPSGFKARLARPGQENATPTPSPASPAAPANPDAKPQQ